MALYLRVSVTDLCDLRCFYCIPACGVARVPHTDVLRFEEIERLCRLLAARMGLTKIRLTGGEPLVRRGVERLIERLAAIPGVADLALTTNGQRLGAMAADLRRAGLRRVNVSLDTLRPERFERISGARNVDASIEGIEAAIRADLVPLRLNTVLLRGINDDELVDLVRFAAERDAELRFIELMRVGEAARWTNRHFLSADEALERLRGEFELVELDRPAGATATHYRAMVDGRERRVGFIRSVSHPFCADCNRLRLTSTGRLRWCLLQDEALDVRSLLRDGASDDRIVEAVAAGLRAKRAPERRLAGSPMNRIGG